MKALFLALVLLAGFTLTQGPVQAAEGLYKTVFTKGIVTFTRDGNKRDLIKGDVLVDGDVVETSNKGLVVLSFGQGFKSKIKLTQNAHFTIEGAKMEKGDDKKLRKTKYYYLKLGNAVIDWVNKDKEKNRLKVKTKTAAMGVRGTRFFTHVQLDNKVVAAVYEGLVMGRHNASGSVGIAMGAGKGAVFLPDGTSREVKDAKWMKQINWELSGTSAEGLRHGNSLLEQFRREFTSYKRKRPKYASSKTKSSGPLSMTDAQKKMMKDCLENKVRAQCSKLGLQLLNNGVGGDHPKVKELFRNGCNQGDDKACVWTGRIEYELGDKDIGKKVVRDQCNGGNSYACYTMWELARADGDSDADKYYQKSLEQLHQIKDLNKALEQFKISCDMDNPGACYNMGLLSENLNRKFEAKKYYTKACDKQDGEACSNLGYLNQEEGKIVEARKLYQKACLKSIPEGCYNLACIHSTQGKSELAITYLKMAVSNGYLDHAHASQDGDLKNVRSHPDYQVIMSMMKSP